MSSNKEAQAARSAADRRLREAHPGEYAAFMEQEHARRGLTWNRRVTPEERAYRERVEREKRALARIHQIAEDNGLAVAVNGSTIVILDEQPSDEDVYEVEAAVSEDRQAEEAYDVYKALEAHDARS